MVKLLFYSHMQWCRNTNIDCGPAESMEDNMFHENYVTPHSIVPWQTKFPECCIYYLYSTALHLSYPRARWIHSTPFNITSFKIHSNTALSCKNMSFKSLHSLQVSPPKSSVHFYSPPRVPLALSSHPPWFHHPSNIWRRLQTFLYNETLCRSHIQNVKLLAILILTPPKTLTSPPESSSMFWIVRVSQLSTRPSPPTITPTNRQ